MKKICFGTAARREKGVLRAAHTYTAIIRECPPGGLAHNASTMHKPDMPLQNEKETGKISH